MATRTYAKGYDLVIHDECSAGVNDQAVVEAVLAPHRARYSGRQSALCHALLSHRKVRTIAVNPNSGRRMDSGFEYLGLQSSGHGPQKPIAISFTDKESSITKGMSDWTTN